MKDQSTAAYNQRANIKEFNLYQQYEMCDLSDIKAIELLPCGYRAEVLGYAAFRNVECLRDIKSLAMFNTGMLRSLCNSLVPVIYVEGDYLFRKVRRVAGCGYMKMYIVLCVPLPCLPNHTYIMLRCFGVYTRMINLMQSFALSRETSSL